MLKIQCDRCNVELDEPGALLFGPPTGNDWTKKLHLCGPCFLVVIEFIHTSKG